MRTAFVVATSGVAAVFGGLVLLAILLFGVAAGVAAGLVLGGSGLFAYAELVLMAKKPRGRR